MKKYLLISRLTVNDTFYERRNDKGFNLEN